MIRLLNTTDREEWRLVILLAAETGLRLSDLVTLSLKSVKFDCQYLVMAPKEQMRMRSKKTITVPLGKSTINCLREFHSSKSGLLFPTMSEKTSSTHNSNFNNLKVRSDNRSMGHRPLHSLRYSFDTWLLQSDVGKDIRISLMAHSSDDVHEIFGTHDENTLQAITTKSLSTMTPCSTPSAFSTKSPNKKNPSPLSTMNAASGLAMPSPVALTAC